MDCAEMPTFVNASWSLLTRVMSPVSIAMVGGVVVEVDGWVGRRGKEQVGVVWCW